MVDSLLSPEEINALLKKTEMKNDELSDEQSKGVELADIEKDVLGEIANIFMGSAATALSLLLGRRTVITAPRVMLTTPKKIWEKYPQDVLTVDVVYESGLQGNNIFVLHEQDAGIFADLMLKGEGKNPPAVLTETHLELIGKAMEKMMAASTIALTQLLDKPIKMSAPALNLTSLKEDKVLYVNVDEPLVKIAFKLKVEGLLDSEMLQILPLSFAKQLASEVLKVKELKQEVSNSIKSTQDNDQVEVTSAELPSFTEGDQLTRTTTLNLDLIMDINLELSVELGKTKKKIKEILELTNGSLVELDKLAGEPVDILVNGNHLAKGEVVVIDENFGVRVIEILSPTERIKKLR